MKTNRYRPLAWTRKGECIICTSHTPKSTGYPYIRRNGRAMSIARHIIFRRLGEQPSSVVSRHTCDNPLCINPSHILSGSTFDNMRDKMIRGRHRNGLRRTKLTPKDVEQIRELSRQGMIQREIAKRFNVERSRISYIITGRSWGHVCSGSGEDVRVFPASPESTPDDERGLEQEPYTYEEVEARRKEIDAI